MCFAIYICKVFLILVSICWIFENPFHLENRVVHLDFLKFSAFFWEKYNKVSLLLIPMWAWEEYVFSSCWIQVFKDAYWIWFVSCVVWILFISLLNIFCLLFQTDRNKKKSPMLVVNSSKWSTLQLEFIFLVNCSFEH